MDRSEDVKEGIVVIDRLHQVFSAEELLAQLKTLYQRPEMAQMAEQADLPSRSSMSNEANRISHEKLAWVGSDDLCTLPMRRSS